MAAVWACARDGAPGAVTLKPAPLKRERHCPRHAFSPRLRPLIFSSTGVGHLMGKGDKRSRRGKIYRGSFGKTRPKDPASRKTKKAAATAGTRR